MRRCRGPHLGHRPGPGGIVTRVEIFLKQLLHFLFQGLLPRNSVQGLDTRHHEADTIGQQLGFEGVGLEIFTQRFQLFGARDMKALRFALERHGKPHWNPVILSRPPFRNIDLDELLSRGSDELLSRGSGELLSRGSGGMPIQQDLCLQAALIGNLCGTENGVDVLL